MKKRCSHCKYLDKDKIYDRKKKIYIDRKIVQRCYRVDAPDIELCPKCKAVL